MTPDDMSDLLGLLVWDDASGILKLFIERERNGHRKCTNIQRLQL